jgi:hypothetical protein
LSSYPMPDDDAFINRYTKVIESAVNRYPWLTWTGKGNITREPIPNEWVIGYGEMTWKHVGYWYLEFHIDIPAIMDKDGTVKVGHTVGIYWPRGYPDDPVGWAWHFQEPHPYHPNVMFGDPIPGTNATMGTEGQPYPQIPGAICINSANSGASFRQMWDDLRDMMSVEDRNILIWSDKDKWAGNGAHKLHWNEFGGLQTGPFSNEALRVWQENYDEFRRGLENPSGGAPSTPDPPNNGGGGTSSKGGFRLKRKPKTKHRLVRR